MAPISPTQARADKGCGAHPFGRSVVRRRLPSVERMTTVSRTFDVRPQPAVVIDYLKDFGNAEQWDPGTESCTRQDSGPVQVGSSWHNVSKIAGVTTELTYTLQELTDDTIIPKLLETAKTGTEERVFVRGDKRVDYGRVAQVMAIVTGGGFKKVALVTEPEHQ